MASKSLNKTRSNKIDPMSHLEEYQKYDTQELLKVLYQYFEKPKNATVLDVGCRAEVVKYMARHVKKIVGINIDENSLATDSCPPNARLQIMDGIQTTFADGTFDFVYSSNLYEHVGNLSKCIDEQLRVLKKKGYCYARWEPIWSGPRGHHIHDDMVRLWEEFCQVESSIYTNNGKFIPDWSHLLLSKAKMIQSLSVKLKSRELVEIIGRYIYESDNLNRLFFDEIEKIFSRKNIRIIFWKKKTADIPSEVLRKLKNKYSYRDFCSINSEVLFTHKTSK